MFFLGFSSIHRVRGLGMVCMVSGRHLHDVWPRMKSGLGFGV